MHLISSGWNFWLCVMLSLKLCLYNTQPGHYWSSFSCKNQCIQSNNSLYDLTDCLSHQSIWALSYQRLKTRRLFFNSGHCSSQWTPFPRCHWEDPHEQQSSSRWFLVTPKTLLWEPLHLGLTLSPGAAGQPDIEPRPGPSCGLDTVHCSGGHRNGPSAFKSFLCTGSADIDRHISGD